MPLFTPAMASVVTGAIGGLTSLGTTMYNKYAQEQANKTNIAFQRETNNQMLAFQREMKEQELRYNSAAEQMMRLKRAGLNPAAMYGGMQMDAGTASGSSAPSLASPHVDAPMLTDSPIRSMISSAEAYANIQHTQSQISSEELGRITEQIRQSKTAAERDMILKELGFMDEKFDLEKEETRAKIANYVQQVEESKSKVRVDGATIGKLMAETGLTEAETNRLVELLPHEIKNMDAETYLRYVQSEEGRSRMELAAKAFYLEQSRFRLDVAKFNSDNTKWTYEKNWQKYTFESQRSDEWKQFTTNLQYDAAKTDKTEANKLFMNNYNNWTRAMTSIIVAGGALTAKANSSSAASPSPLVTPRYDNRPPVNLYTP